MAGTTILQGIQGAVSKDTKVEYSAFGNFPYMPGKADVGIVVIGENPYAEGVGDSAYLSLTQPDLVARVKEQAYSVIVVVLSGRPVNLGEDIHQWDAVAAAWLPGSEGEGVAEVLFGQVPFTGRLPYTWPRNARQLPFDLTHLPSQGCAAPLFPSGYGLKTSDPSPTILDCP